MPLLPINTTVFQRFHFPPQGVPRHRLRGKSHPWDPHGPHSSSKYTPQGDPGRPRKEDRKHPVGSRTPPGLEKTGPGGPFLPPFLLLSVFGNHHQTLGGSHIFTYKKGPGWEAAAAQLTPLHFLLFAVLLPQSLLVALGQLCVRGVCFSAPGRPRGTPRPQKASPGVPCRPHRRQNAYKTKGKRPIPKVSQRVPWAPLGRPRDLRRHQSRKKQRSQHANHSPPSSMPTPTTSPTSSSTCATLVHLPWLKQHDVGIVQNRYCDYQCRRKHCNGESGCFRAQRCRRCFRAHG